MKYLYTFAGVCALTLSAASFAAPVAVTSYDTPNGDGTASGGSYNYWDVNYTGAGATSTDGAALSGGLGDLTDGVVAADFWYNVENNSGNGPYVGWYQPATLNPTVIFNFAGSPTITDIGIHIDNSHAGGVFAPADIWIDGISTAFVAPPIGTIGWINFTGLNLSGGSHSIQFFQAGGWVFVSEITFDGRAGNPVPEPAAWALFIVGFGAVGASLRRRQAVLV